MRPAAGIGPQQSAGQSLPFSPAEQNPSPQLGVPVLLDVSVWPFARSSWPLIGSGTTALPP